MPLPHAPQADLTLRLARDPYRLIGRTAAALGTTAFRGRVLLRDTVFLTGAAQSRAFYESGLSRRGAAPRIVRATLFGQGGVQGLDGAAHLRRKAMFLRVLTGEAPHVLAGRLEASLDAFAAERPARIVVQDEMVRILTRLACDWAGIPVPAAEMPRRARQLANLFDHAVPVTPRYLLALRDRRLADAWAAELVSAVRAGDLAPPDGSALAEVAACRDLSGNLLDADVAAVELLNVIRPIVAVSAWLTFLAHAVAVQAAAPAAACDRPLSLVQEVRRTYPFFPVAAAVAPRAMSLAGAEVAAGTRVMLDLYGTNRDPAIWEDPAMFRPSRFDGRAIGPHELVPQGGGDQETGHRCAGEQVTLALMQTFTAWLTRIAYRRPPQDMDLDMTGLPALPSSRMVWEGLRPA